MEWPGVEFVGKGRIAFEGEEYFLLDEHSFPGMAKIIEEQFATPGGEVLVLSGEAPGVYLYEIFGKGTHFTTTDATGKVKVNRQYLQGVCNGIHTMREVLEDLIFSSSEPVADFVDGNFGEDDGE